MLLWLSKTKYTSLLKAQAELAQKLEEVECRQVTLIQTLEQGKTLSTRDLQVIAEIDTFEKLADFMEDVTLDLRQSVEAGGNLDWEGSNEVDRR